MGSRGNICVRQPEGDVFFYTHWLGHATKNIAAKALDRGRPRWDDETYLARIVFCEFFDDMEDVRAETGFGIGLTECDPQYPTVYIDTTARNVTVGNDTHSFDDFVSLYT